MTLSDRLRRRGLDREIAEEIQSHIDLEIEQNISEGLAPEEARRAALLRFGSPALAQEDCRAVWHIRFFQEIAQDLRYAVRSLRHTPGFSAAALLILALGIGANTSLFALVNAALIKPLPFKDADRLITVWENSRRGSERNTCSSQNLADWRSQNRVFERLAGFRDYGFALRGSDEPESVPASLVSSEFFSVLGAAPALGQGFTAADDWPNRSYKVVLSHRLWMRRFAGDRSILGRSLNLVGWGEERSFVVVGVMPPEFDATDVQPAELWAPLSIDPDEMSSRGLHNRRAIARLKPGVTLRQAQSEMDTIAGRLSAQHPETNRDAGIRLIPLREFAAGEAGVLLLVLWALFGFVLLIVCANVTGLLLARAAHRRREIAIRLSLGAGRGRIVRQLITESVVLVAGGGAVGIAVAAWSARAFVRLAPLRIPGTTPGSAGIDGRVLVFCLVVTLACGVAVGLVPALRLSRSRSAELLRAGRGADSDSRQRVRIALVAGELSIALALLFGAGLLVHSLARLARVESGFDARNVLTVSFAPRGFAGEALVAFYPRLLEQVNALPGVEAAGGTSCLPLSCRESIRFRIDGGPVPGLGERPMVEFRNVTPEYFRTLRIRLLHGRFFTDADSANALPVAIVNESFSKRFFASQDPVGTRILAGGGETPSQIVGVVADIRHGGLAQGPTPEMYWPYAQNGRGAIRLAVRTTLPPSALVADVRRTIATLAPGTVIDSVSTLESAMDRNLAPRYFVTSVIVCFAFVALLLAAAGVYGVMSYSAAQRTREIGLRVALGAQRHEITRLVMRQSGVVTAAGLGFGLPVCFVLSRVINGLLFATSPFDPLTLVGVSVLLGLVSLTASYLPARRALQLDPLAALRCE